MLVAVAVRPPGDGPRRRFRHQRCIVKELVNKFIAFHRYGHVPPQSNCDENKKYRFAPDACANYCGNI